MNIMDKLKTYKEIFSSYKMASNFQRKSHKRPSYTYLWNDTYRHAHPSVRKALFNLGRNSSSQNRDVVVQGAFNPWAKSGDLFKEIKRPGYDPGEGPEASGRRHLSPVNCPGKCTSSPYKDLYEKHRDSYKEIMECMKNCENKMIDDDIESSEKLDLRTHHDNTQHMEETKHECQLDAHCRRSQNELVNQSKCDNQEHKLGCGNTHEKKFQCSKCTREYEYKRSLHRHEQMKHKTPQIRLCTVCGKEYKYKSSLIRHMSTKHKQST